MGIDVEAFFRVQEFTKVSIFIIFSVGAMRPVIVIKVVWQ